MFIINDTNVRFLRYYSPDKRSFALTCNGRDSAVNTLFYFSAQLKTQTETITLRI